MYNVSFCLLPSNLTASVTQRDVHTYFTYIFSKCCNRQTSVTSRCSFLGITPSLLQISAVQYEQRADKLCLCDLTTKMVPGLLNFSSDASNQTARMSSLSLFTISLHGLLSCVGILENLLILGVVGFHVHRSIIRIWILNLAVSDLLATLSLPFFTHYMASGHTWTLGTTFCRIHSSIFFLNMFVSGFLLGAISLDRCLLVLRPVWAQNYRSIQMVTKMCMLIWVLAVLCTIPFYMFRDTIPQPDGKIQCYYNYAQYPPSEPYDLGSLCKQREKALALLKFILAFLIPLLIIIFSYSAANARLARRGRRRFRFVRLVAAVVVSFVLCWAPYHLLFIIQVMAPKDHPAHKYASEALPITATIGFLNSVLNPVLYVFSCPDLCTTIRHSLAKVMDSVLAEDLVELARRRSTTS